jgi:hypothetical protein
MRECSHLWRAVQCKASVMAVTRPITLDLCLDPILDLMFCCHSFKIFNNLYFHFALGPPDYVVGSGCDTSYLLVFLFLPVQSETSQLHPESLLICKTHQLTYKMRKLNHSSATLYLPGLLRIQLSLQPILISKQK